MTDPEMLEIILKAVVGINIYIICFLLYNIFYTNKALRYLRKTAQIMKVHDDNEQLKEINEKSIPVLKEIKPLLFFETVAAIIILGVNLITYMYSMIPTSQLLGSWNVLIYMSSIGTAYLIVSIYSLKTLKLSIDVVCASYDITLNGYELLDEEKEKNDDGSD